MRWTVFALVFGSAVTAYPQQSPIMQAILPRYQNMRLNLIETAQVMPEDGYAYKLTPAQRSFGEWLGHQAQANFTNCAQIAGRVAPDMAHVHAAKSKAEVEKVLRESFDFCDEALKGMTDERAVQAVTVGERKVYPINAMVGLIAVLNEHYGNLVGYMRSKGITPPSTARAQKAKK